MSSVLVKGMEMPKNCAECPIRCLCLFYTGRVDIRSQDCPITEIKEPHGRLGDLDKLKAKFRHSEKDDEVDKAWNSAVRRIITQAETIIEPEGSKE